MRMHPFHRTELLLGGDGFRRLSEASVCVIGLGGVGSYAAEALARSGVGHLTLVDFDRVCLTNLNRQLHATRSTVGKVKAELMGDRVRDIHPKCDVRVIPRFFDETTLPEVLDRPYDAVLDCIDHMQTKLLLLRTCVGRGQAVWSAMGAGGKLDPSRIRITDLDKTHTDPLARIVRKRLREEGITTGIQCVWSDELPAELDAEAEAGFTCICPDRADTPYSCDRRYQVQGTVAWMPPIVGLTMAGAVTRHIVGLAAAEAALPEDERQALRASRQRPAVGKPGKAEKRALTLAALQPVSRQALDAGAAGGAPEDA
ncbi:MAG: tRNA threonylcarbamoyladenosine dehydratase [Alphaproteobacteria bacterium]|nr:tRNA threonylcarbamoyladenosine dehydratase [Alphaproteobacteria bacterium]